MRVNLSGSGPSQEQDPEGEAAHRAAALAYAQGLKEARVNRDLATHPFSLREAVVELLERWNLGAGTRR